MRLAVLVLLLPWRRSAAGAQMQALELKFIPRDNATVLASVGLRVGDETDDLPFARTCTVPQACELFALQPLKDDLIGAWRTRQRTTSHVERQVVQLHDVFILGTRAGPAGMPFSSRGFWPVRLEQRPQRGRPADTSQMARALATAGARRFDSAISMLHGVTYNFCLFVTEALPRLLPLLPLPRHVHLLLHASDFAAPFLAALGVPRSQIHFVADDAEVIFVKNLTLVAHRPLTPMGMLHAAEVRALRDRLAPSEREAAAPQDAGSVHVVLAARATARRQLSNQAELAEAIRTISFKDATVSLTILHGDKSTLQQTRSIMRSARAVVGVHGANLANIMFCLEGTTLVEIAPCCPRYDNFYQLATFLRMPYWIVPVNGTRDGPVTAPVGTVRSILRAIFPHVGVGADEDAPRCSGVPVWTRGLLQQMCDAGVTKHEL